MATQTSFSNLSGPATAILTTFTCFSDLPTEIRLKIWREAALGPRIIKIVWRSIHGATSRVKGPSRVRPALKVLTKFPWIIHANIEARTETLKAYTLAFKKHPNIRPIYMDLDRDAIFIDNEIRHQLFPIYNYKWMKEGSKFVFEHLKHLIIENEMLEDAGPLFCKLKKLQTLCFTGVHEMYHREDCNDHAVKMIDLVQKIRTKRRDDLGDENMRFKITFVRSEMIEELAETSKEGLLESMPVLEGTEECEMLFAEDEMRIQTERDEGQKYG